MGTALEATPTLSGHLIAAKLMILVPCSLISPSKGASPTHTHNMLFGVPVKLDPDLLEMIYGSYVHVLNHLMVIISANHLQISLVIR